VGCLAGVTATLLANEPQLNSAPDLLLPISGYPHPSSFFEGSGDSFWRFVYILGGIPPQVLSVWGYRRQGRL